ncbi:hypothetical protein GCM10023335_68270 [Streptomyces siamensis]|uniref:Uncharacterized protein n=1 Tax=Streptomyces siamensis TaxID=1274986 RepID=A0ABP9JEA6_9ACTN
MQAFRTRTGFIVGLAYTAGRLIWASDALPGAVHDLTAAGPTASRLSPLTTSSAGLTGRIRAQALLSASRSGARTCAAGVVVTTAITPRFAASANALWPPSNAGAS